MHSHSAEDTAAMFIQRAHRQKLSRHKARGLLNKLRLTYRMGRLRDAKITPMEGEAELIRRVTKVQALYRKKQAKVVVATLRAERAATRIATELSVVDSMMPWWSCNAD